MSLGKNHKLRGEYLRPSASNPEYGAKWTNYGIVFRYSNYALHLDWNELMMIDE